MPAGKSQRSVTGMTQHLTERSVNALVPAIDRDVLVYDDAVTGFGVFILRSGKRGVFLRYRIAGRERRFTIDAWPTWSVTAAREEAKRLKREAQPQRVARRQHQ